MLAGRETCCNGVEKNNGRNFNHDAATGLVPASLLRKCCGLFPATDRPGWRDQLRRRQHEKLADPSRPSQAFSA
jgi:hypothetical protein